MLTPPVGLIGLCRVDVRCGQDYGRVSLGKLLQSGLVFWSTTAREGTTLKGLR